VIRKMALWAICLPVGFFCITSVGQEVKQGNFSFSLYAQPYQKPKKSEKPTTGKDDPVRYLPELNYRDGKEVHSIKLLPGRQSKRLHYASQSPLTLYRVLPENNATEIAAVIRVEPNWEDVLFVLYPKDVAGRTYRSFPIDRSLAAKTPGAGVVSNLSRETTLVEINGIKRKLSPGQVSSFRMQREGEEFTRIMVSIETDNGWTAAYSSKRYLSNNPGTTFLLSPTSGNSRVKLKVVTLSPPR
jgi:hypothetical protein